MTENQADISQEPSKKIDLNELAGLNFGPSWADENSKASQKEPSKQKLNNKRSTSAGKRDRRGFSAEHSSRGDQSGKWDSGKQNMHRKEGRKNWKQSQRDSFQPTVKVAIYPQDEAFDALVKRLRSTVRTYQLFEIANLILEKPERYQIVVQNKEKKGEPLKKLYHTLPDYLPFDNEDAAINYVLTNHLDRFFDMEAVEMEPPKSNFQIVSRCTVTGELLGPPNYHRYQEFLQQHYSSRINNMSFDQFVSKVESVKEQESIDAWVESMKKGIRYILKERKEGEPEFFESLESVRSFLLQNRRDTIIGSGETVRFAGRDLERLPKGAIRSSADTYIEQQLRFPLDTANNIRGRLRRHKFTVYKKGSEGVSYVCAVRRKFRDSKTTFTASIQDVIQFIEQHPEIPASKVPKLYLGIDTDKQTPEKLAIAESEIAAEKAVAQNETVVSDNKTEPVPAPEAVEPASPDVVEKTKPELSEDDLKRLNQLMLDLRWLVTEGYVTEYGDGRLFASPPMPETKPKTSEETSTKSKSEQSADETTEAASQSEKAITGS